jgi:hypothetical protein
MCSQVVSDAGGSWLGSGWPGGWSPSDEAAAVGGGVGVNGHAELVDGDVMVVPAQSYQV